MSVIILIVHAAIWTTLGCGLYLLWMNGKDTSSLASFARAYHLSQIVDALQGLWLIVGIGLIVLVLMSVLFPTLPANASAPPSCPTPSAQVAVANATATPTPTICAPTPTAIPTAEQHLGPD